MSDTWTFSEWSVGDADPAAFIEAFRGFATAATDFGGAREGMVLQDVQDQGHFVVVRRWDSADDVGRWAAVQAEHGEELRRLVPEGGRAVVMTQVAELGQSGAGRL